MADSETFQVIEWTIKNFSHWCEPVHGKCIKSPDTFYCYFFPNVKIYPKGRSGQDDQMEVRFCNVKEDFAGEMSFIGFDGSSICSQRVKITKTSEKVPGISVDLKFEEVLAQIRKTDQKDQITLRFCFQSRFHREQRMCTTLGVMNLSFEIDPKLIGKTESKDILYFVYISHECNGMCLKLAQQDDRIQLKMVPDDEKDEASVMVESSVSMVSSDRDIVRKEEVKHVFINKDAWIISESLTVKELEEKGIIILLRLKVTNGEIFQKYNQVIYNNEANFLPTDSSFCFCKHKSPVSANQKDDSVTVLLKELMCLFQDQDFSDFRLKCGDVTFPVHKNILNARSPVFKTMLSCDMKEAASSEVVIGDLDPSTLALFLAFLYTGAVKDLQSDRALKLYYAADKYQVSSLKKECSHHLRNHMSVENVCDILTLADKHKDSDLTSVSHDFILNNFNELLRSSKWENFTESEPVLALKTLTLFGKKNYLGKLHMPRA